MSNIRRKTILVLTSTFPRYKGDYEPAFILDLVKRYTEEFDVFVLAPHVKGARRSEIIEDINIYRYKYAPEYLERLCYSGGIVQNIKRNPLLVFLVPPLFLFQLLSALSLIKKFSISIVHAHWVIPQGVIAFLLKKIIQSDIRLITTLHGSDLFSLNNVLFKYMRRKVLVSSDEITVVSETMRNSLEQEIGDEREIKIIPMGTDLQDRFVPDHKLRRKCSFLFVGRLIPIKGVNYLLKAFRRVNAVMPESTLSIVGTGPEEARLKKSVVEYNLQNKVQFLGGISQEMLPKIYQSHEVAVFPFTSLKSSSQEAFGIVMVEALGCGCSVIASDIPAARFLLGGGERGILVPQGNPELLAKHMIKLSNNLELRREFEKKGRAYALEHFDWDKIGERYRKMMSPH